VVVDQPGLKAGWRTSWKERQTALQEAAILSREAKGASKMITITDITTKNQENWEVVDSTGILGKTNFPYDATVTTGYDRVRVLRQIVDVYTMLSGCKTQRWSEPGKVFILE
jgi:hypothetical protein